jgi:hypothetical protein
MARPRRGLHGGSVTQTSHLSASRADPESFTTCGVPPYPAADDDVSQSQARTTGRSTEGERAR